jgi:hypothetical protein
VIRESRLESILLLVYGRILFMIMIDVQRWEATAHWGQIDVRRHNAGA